MAKFVGAIALGLIYQFYYGMGDTFGHWNHGSRWIWEAFMDNPILGLKMMFSEAGVHEPTTFKYSSNIWYYRSSASMTLIKIIAAIDLLTFRTYSTTALFFAIFSFSGSWAFYSVIQKKYPGKTKLFALAILFIPSVVFWGSGILKDTITFGSFCWMTAIAFSFFVDHKISLLKLLLCVILGLLIYSIKIYILLSFLFALSIFLLFQYLSKLNNVIQKIIVAPVLIVLFIGGGYFIIDKVSEDNSRYALDKIGETAMITAHDIRYGWGARNGDNSGYTLGTLDGTLGSLIRLAPEGIIVTLFRPMLWEVKNPLMLLAALESLVFALLTCYVIFQSKWSKLSNPIIIFCLSFSLLFAAAVGISTFNFGTLMRYKIPVMPIYACFLALIFNTKTD